MPAQLTTDINKMIKSSYGRNLKRLELLNDSENNLNVKCSNENCTIQGNLQVFRHCTKCSAYFCNRCCDLSENVEYIYMVRRSLNFLTNGLIITGFFRVGQNPLYPSLLKKILKKDAKYFLKLLKKK